MLNREPGQTAQEGAGRASPFFSHLWRVLSHNWGWKLAAVLLAVALWGGLILQDATVTRERAFSDVHVTVVGTSDLLRNGFIVTGGLEDTQTVRFTADVPQSMYYTANAENYDLRIDLSRVYRAGEQTLPITYTDSETYGRVTALSQTSVNVTVEEYTTRSRIPVRVETVGQAPEGYYATAAMVDPPLVTIAGPASLVQNVARCVARYDMSALSAREGTERTGTPFVLYDAYGGIVDKSLINVTTESVLLDSVLVEQTLYPQKTIKLNTLGVIGGEPEKGYRVANVSLQPSEVVVAGNSAALAAADFMYLYNAIDISGASRTLTRMIQLSKPADIVYTNADIVYVTVEIEPITENKVFRGIPVRVVGLSPGLAAVAATAEADVEISGEQNWLETLKADDISLTIDAGGLGVGQYTLPVACAVSAQAGQAFKCAVPDMVIVIREHP